MSAHRPWAWPLVPMYCAALAVKAGLRRAGVLGTRTLSWPVISVGSVSSGGAGKTPVVLALAKLLQDHGANVDVLSRGYGREGRGVEQVGTDAVRFGDEPVLIAQRTGAPVWVGADRYAAGLAAERAATTHKNIHLLDDGFQHQQLARALDIVLVTAEDLDDALLPAGNLREPLSALRRAAAFVVREDEAAAVTPHLSQDAPVWTIRRSLRFPAQLGVLAAGLRPLAFCAIARPESFAANLVQAGCGVIDTVIFRDHQRYSPQQIHEIIAFAKERNATGLVTTEKDAVKLCASTRALLEREVGPLMVVALDTEFLDPEAVLRTIESRLR